MVSVWSSSGVRLVFVWFSFGFPVVLVWFSYGSMLSCRFRMVSHMCRVVCVCFRFVWKGVAVMFVWCSYGVRLVFAWCSYGFRVVRVWFRMVFAWLSDVFIRCSCGFPLLSDGFRVLLAVARFSFGFRNAISMLPMSRYALARQWMVDKSWIKDSSITKR